MRKCLVAGGKRSSMIIEWSESWLEGRQGHRRTVVMLTAVNMCVTTASGLCVSFGPQKLRHFTCHKTSNTTHIHRSFLCVCESPNASKQQKKEKSRKTTLACHQEEKILWQETSETLPQPLRFPCIYFLALCPFDLSGLSRSKAILSDGESVRRENSLSHRKNMISYACRAKIFTSQGGTTHVFKISCKSSLHQTERSLPEEWSGDIRSIININRVKRTDFISVQETSNENTGWGGNRNACFRFRGLTDEERWEELPKIAVCYEDMIAGLCWRSTRVSSLSIPSDDLINGRRREERKSDLLAMHACFKLRCRKKVERNFLSFPGTYQLHCEAREWEERETDVTSVSLIVLWLKVGPEPERDARLCKYNLPAFFPKHTVKTHRERKQIQIQRS